MKQVMFCVTLVEGRTQNNIVLLVLLLSACFKTNFKTLLCDHHAGMLKTTDDPSEKNPSEQNKFRAFYSEAVLLKFEKKRWDCVTM